jgi:hypothetical protein
MTDAVEKRPALEVADIIRIHGQAFLAKHGRTLSGAQRKALRDLAACRTAALGGHVEECLDCGARLIAYNSCRNRHCPKCQARSRAGGCRWRCCCCDSCRKRSSQRDQTATLTRPANAVARNAAAGG